MPQQMKEVEITAHHRPTEWVKAGWWAFIAIVFIIIVCGLFIQRPHSLGDFWSDVMTDFVVAVVIIVVIIGGTIAVIWLHKKHKVKVVDVGQFGTVVIEGKKTRELAPLIAENLEKPGAVNLIQPSEKAGKFLPYVQLASYLQAKGVDLNELEDCIDEQDDPEPIDEFEQPHMELTDLQKRVLNLWEQGKRGRLSIHKADPTISEHIASRTIAELKGAGLIR